MAGRIKAALGSLAFLVLAPGVVAGLLPWLITHWSPLPPGDGPGALRWTGLILIAAGLAVVLEAFARFAWEGLGTPAPVAPTRTLVVSGFYRFVRNPMYVAVTALIFGQAILFASWGVALYGVVIAAAFHTFVRLYEEPTLRRGLWRGIRRLLRRHPALDPPVQALISARRLRHRRRSEPRGATRWRHVVAQRSDACDVHPGRCVRRLGREPGRRTGFASPRHPPRRRAGRTSLDRAGPRGGRGRMSAPSRRSRLGSVTGLDRTRRRCQSCRR